MILLKPAAVAIHGGIVYFSEKGVEMNAEQKKRPATSAGRQNEFDLGEAENRNVSGFAGTKNQADSRTENSKLVHISQKEAQSIPADKDPDDPVSR